MDLRAVILEENSTWNTEPVTNYVGNDKERFKQLMQLFLSDEYKVAQRASQAMTKCTDKHPELIKPWIAKMTDNLYREGLSDAVKRNTMRVFQFTDIPEKCQGKLFDISMKFLLSMHEPIAVKAFASTVLYNISLKHPELQSELKMVLGDLARHASDPALKNRYNKVLKDLLKQ